MGNHMTRLVTLTVLVLYQIIFLKAEKSANFNSAKTCNVYTGPRLEGLTHIGITNC